MSLLLTLARMFVFNFLTEAARSLAERFVLAKESYRKRRRKHG